MQVLKLDGTYEEYDEKKLANSLARSGVAQDVQKKIIDKVRSELFEGISTSKIYKRAYKLLEHEDAVQPEVTFRYSLRRSISEFGPSGFPFERFVGEIFRLKGYNIQVGKVLKGKCASHEMDVVGHKDDEVFTAELKFHNRLTIKTDLKVALYVRARFDDLIAGGIYGEKKQRLAIITNTKFSSNAIRYSECAGIELIGWNYPRQGQGNLHDLVQESGIHPLTCLSTLSKKQKLYFLDKQAVLCQDLSADDYKMLREAREVIPKSKIDKIIEEIVRVCECVGPTCVIE